MRAIIIEEKDALALLDQLKLERFKGGRTGTMIEQVSDAHYKLILEDVHRTFHFVVCRWLQDQGASCVRNA